MNIALAFSLVLCTLTVNCQRIKINTELSYFVTIANASEVGAHEMLLANHFEYKRKEIATDDDMGFRVYGLGLNNTTGNAVIFVFKYDTRGNLKVQIGDTDVEDFKKKFLPFKISSTFDDDDNLQIDYRYKGQQVELTQKSTGAIIDIFPK